MAGERKYGNPQQGAHPRPGAAQVYGHSQAARTQGPGQGQGQGGATGTIEQMGARVADVAGQVKDRVQDAASGVAQRAEDAWDSTRQGVSQGASAVAQRAEDFWTSASNLIRRYPVTSVVIAFGLGCLTTACLQNVCGFDLGSDDVANRMSRSSS